MRMTKEKFVDSIKNDVAFYYVLQHAYDETPMIREVVDLYLNSMWESYERDSEKLDS